MSLPVPSPTDTARSIVLIAIFFLALSQGFHCQTTSKIQLLGSGSTLTEGKKFNFMMITPSTTEGKDFTIPKIMFSVHKGKYVTMVC